MKIKLYASITGLACLCAVAAPIANARELVSETRIKYNINSSDTKKVKVRLYDDDKVEVEVNSVWLKKQESVYKFKVNEPKDFFGMLVTFVPNGEDGSLKLEVMGLPFDISGKSIEAKVGFSGSEKLSIKISDSNTESMFVYCSVSKDADYKEIRAVKRKKDFFSLREERIDLLSEDFDSKVKFIFLKNGNLYETNSKNIFNNYMQVSTLPPLANCDDITSIKEETWNMRIEYFDFLLKCPEGQKAKKKKGGFSFFGLF